MPNLKKVQDVTKELQRALDAIDDAETEREKLREQRDTLNNQLTSLTQKITARKSDIDLNVNELKKALQE